MPPLKTIQSEMPLLLQLMKGIAAEFGDNCEIVLHDYSGEDYRHTIAAIENAHVSGRKVGDCGTNLGLEILRGLSNIEDQHGYLTRSKDGKILRSTSVYIHDDDGKTIGALCINWDVSDIAASINTLQRLVKHEPEQQVQEIITNDVSELLDSLIEESIQFVGKPVIHMCKEDKVAGLRRLDQKGAFLVKYASDRIAKAYNISKNTLYNYLEKFEPA